MFVLTDKKSGGIYSVLDKDAVKTVQGLVSYDIVAADNGDAWVTAQVLS